MWSSILFAQENEFGNWLMYFGTNKLSDNWSIHSEVQYRNHTIEPVNIEQLLFLTGLNYHVNKNASVTIGYGYTASHDFKSEHKEPVTKENQIFQQLTLKNQFSRLRFEHRYRFEQRWINDDFRTRIRYRLMLFVPLNNSTITTGTFFLGIHDEILMNLEKVFYDRNRVYGALGYQFNKETQLQLGYMYQRANDFGKSYLQVGLTFNPDFTKEHKEMALTTK
jgi:long-subunit fatty acid transport protein